MKPEETWRWLELWERACGHSLTEEEEARLNRAILDQPEVRALLAEAALMDAELNLAAEETTGLAAGDTPAQRMLPAQASWQGRLSRILLPLAAAVVSAGAVWLWDREPPPVATLARAADCKWGNSALPTLEGSGLKPGSLELLDGIATVRFASGAVVALEAPVTLEVISAMECRVVKGTVVADVPEQARGFTIHMEETKVVDYGTRFGVSAGEDGKCLVHVIEGLVEVERLGESKARELRAGQRADYGGFLRSVTHPDPQTDSSAGQPEPGRWLPGPVHDLGDGWQVLTTAFGRGKDTWIQSSDYLANGRESFVRIKHTTHSANLDRKAYVAFDLNRLEGRRIAEAEFTVHVEPSDMGFASLVPDATFSVYGLTDETQDFWKEGELNWAAAPAHGPEPACRLAPAAGQAEKLGQFTVPQGATRGGFSIGGEALAAFLRSDTNGVVTFIIVRDTDETALNGLVHAFATKENTRNAPPMLKLRLE